MVALNGASPIGVVPNATRARRPTACCQAPGRSRAGTPAVENVSTCMGHFLQKSCASYRKLEPHSLTFQRRQNHSRNTPAPAVKVHSTDSQIRESHGAARRPTLVKFARWERRQK